MHKDEFELCLKYSPVELIGRYVFVKSSPKHRYGIITHITKECIIYKYLSNSHHDFFHFVNGRININNFQNATIQSFLEIWSKYYSLEKEKVKNRSKHKELKENA